jgi:hypothetical protein
VFTCYRRNLQIAQLLGCLVRLARFLFSGSTRSYFANGLSTTMVRCPIGCEMQPTAIAQWSDHMRDRCQIDSSLEGDATLDSRCGLTVNVDLLLARLDEDNREFLDFHIFPSIDRPKKFRVSLNDAWLCRSKRLNCQRRCKNPQSAG